MYSVSYEVFKKGTDHVEYMTLIGEPTDDLKGYVRRLNENGKCYWVFFKDDFIEYNKEGLTWVIGILIHLGYEIIKCEVKRILFMFNST
jgi:hypothetical protein